MHYIKKVYKPIKPPPPESSDADRPRVPSLIGTVCFCFFPEYIGINTNNRDNRDVLDVTNEIFLKRFFATFLFWKKNFISVGGGKPDLYGPIWMTLTYVIVMGFSANLNVYFIDHTDYEFEQSYYLQIIGICVLFFLIELILYPSMIKCLGGFVSSDEVNTVNLI